MDHFQEIYRSRAAAYHRMIAAEDVDGNLLPALERVTALRGQCVVDLGTGTGRLPLLLHEQVGYLVGLDLYADMLHENAAQRARVNGGWDLVQADMRQLPFADEAADVVLAGWAIGHMRGWFAGDWQAQIGQVLREMERVVRPGGALIIMETLGTGSLTPAPPNGELAEYYAWLENEWSFTRQEIATDYRFASVEDAVAHTEFFFGHELAAQIRQNGWAQVPEWTGVWGKKVAGWQGDKVTR